MRKNCRWYGILCCLSVLVGWCACGDESLRVAVEKLDLKFRADGLSMSKGSVSLNDSVKVLGEYVVVPSWSGSGIKAPSAAVLPHWLKVEVEGEEGYIPEGVLASRTAIDLAVTDTEKMTGAARKVTRGFSEVEDDVALSTMKGAAGKNALGKSLAPDKLKAAMVTGTPDVADIKQFLSDGELETIAFPVRAASDTESRAEKLIRHKGIDPSMVAKFKKLKELTKANKDPEIKLAMDAMQTMINRSFAQLDPVREHVIGEYVAARFVARRKVVPSDDPRSVYVRNLGHALISAANGPASYLPCQFMVIDAPTVTNACAISGGYVFVMSGLLDFVQDEDELACVLAHELAHVELHHGIRAVGASAVFQLFSTAADYALAKEKKADGDFAKALDLVFAVMTESAMDGYGAEIEAEADWRGMQLAARLGYDTSAMVETFKRLKVASGGVGGAGYPKNRIEDAVAYREGFGFDRMRSQGRRQRKLRFAKIMGR